MGWSGARGVPFDHADTVCWVLGKVLDGVVWVFGLLDTVVWVVDGVRVCGRDILLVAVVESLREPVCRLHPGRRALVVPVFHFLGKIFGEVAAIGVYGGFSSFSEFFGETNGYLLELWQRFG